MVAVSRGGGKWGGLCFEGVTPRVCDETGMEEKIEGTCDLDSGPLPEAGKRGGMELGAWGVRFKLQLCVVRHSCTGDGCMRRMYAPRLVCGKGLWRGDVLSALMSR